MNLNLEALESRWLLFTYGFSAGVITITIPGGTDDVVAGNVSGGGTLTITVKEGGGAVVPVDTWPIGTVNSVNINLGSGNDTINLSNLTKPTTIQGALGNDNITGGNGNDYINGGGDNDTINGSAGNDILDGGGNNDSILGGTGLDTADYSTRTAAVTATIDGTGGNGQAGENDTLGGDIDSIFGGSGNDTLTGNANPNYLYGGLGNDSLIGGSGNDIICGGAGRDTMYGNDGNDNFFALDGEIDVIDGGAGTDGAQTDPAEGAPLPDGGAETPLPVEEPAPTPVFSDQRITRPKAPVKRAPASSPVASAPPLPGGPVGGGPAGFGGDAPKDVEGGITQSQIDELARFLLPYTLGQILVTRSFQGQVLIGGTPADDEITVQTFGAQQKELINIINNGGSVQFVLPTPTIFLNNRSGFDKFSVRGDRKSSIAWFEPTKEPNIGSFTLDDRKILYGLGANNAPIESFGAEELAKFKFVTPAANDFLTLQGPKPREPVQKIAIHGVSDNIVLPNMEVEGVTLVEVDTGQHEPQGDSRDILNFINFSEGGTRLMLTPSNPPAAASNDFIQVEGPLILANNPTLPDRPPTVDFDLTQSPGASIQFLSPLTQIRSLLLGAASSAVVGPGDATLVLKKLEMFTGAGAPPSNIDITDGTLILDHDGDKEALPFVRQQIINAYDPRSTDHWFKPGIGSSKAAGDSRTGIGYADALALFGDDGGIFHGLRIDPTAVLVSFTLLGDGDLDRKVDFNDLARLAQNYNSRGNTHTWLQGDFTYDGIVDFNDLASMAQNYNKSLFT
jgi:hypothetical protein